MAAATALRSDVSLTQAEGKRRRRSHSANITGKLIAGRPARSDSLRDRSCRTCVQAGDGDEKGDSSPPPKRSCSADGSSRRVTFNLNMQERALHQAPSPVTLKEAADIVVHYLDPFYTRGKFATKVGVFHQAASGDLEA